MLYLLHLLLSGWHKAVDPRFTSFTLNLCYLSHSFYILGSMLHANLLKNNQYKAKKSIFSNWSLNKLEIFKTSIWPYNLCVKMQTGDLLSEKWLSSKSSKYYDPICRTSNELTLTWDNKIKCYLVDILGE